MKKLILLLPLLFFISCSSGQVNDVKIGVAEKIGDGVEKLLKKEYQGVSAELNCDAEAEKAAGEVVEFVKEKLKVKAENKMMAMSSVSVGEEVAKTLCKIAAKEFLPMLFNSNVEGYACAKVKFGEYSSHYIGDKLCSQIDL